MDPVKMHLTLDADDFETEVRGYISAMESGEEVLRGRLQSMVKSIQDGFPSAIAKRVRKMTPPGFVVESLEITLEVRGGIAVLDLGGSVKVKFVRGETG